MLNDVKCLVYNAASFKLVLSIGRNWNVIQEYRDSVKMHFMHLCRYVSPESLQFTDLSWAHSRKPWPTMRDQLAGRLLVSQIRTSIDCAVLCCEILQSWTNRSKCKRRKFCNVFYQYASFLSVAFSSYTRWSEFQKLPTKEHTLLSGLTWHAEQAKNIKHTEYLICLLYSSKYWSFIYLSLQRLDSSNLFIIPCSISSILPS